jgi:RNA polymerase sigma factor for flagellar operon FliA
MTRLTLERDHHVGEQRHPEQAADAEDPGELWQDYTRGTAPDGRDRLVLHYEPLVRQVAGRVGNRLPAHIEHSDLIQAGVFGLMDAIDRFLPGLGIRFEIYATQRIRGAILDELRAQDWVPRMVRNRARELAKAREMVEAKLQRQATAAELAAELGVGSSEVRSILNQIHLISLEALEEWASARGATVPVAEMFAQLESDPGIILESRENGELLGRSLARLSDRDRCILRLYYSEGLTLAQIGVRLGVTESRVSQLRSRALVRLRAEYTRLAGVEVQLS